MAKRPPKPGLYDAFFRTLSDDAGDGEDEIGGIAFPIGRMVADGQEPPPPSMGARLSFRDWDWLTHIMRRS